MGGPLEYYRYPEGPYRQTTRRQVSRGTDEGKGTHRDPQHDEPPQTLIDPYEYPRGQPRKPCFHLWTVVETPGTRETPISVGRGMDFPQSRLWRENARVEEGPKW